MILSAKMQLVFARNFSAGIPGELSAKDHGEKIQMFSCPCPVLISQTENQEKYIYPAAGAKIS